MADAPSFTKLNQSGGTALPGVDPSGRGNSWALEESLDIEDHLQPGGCRRLTDDPEVLAKPPGEIVPERVGGPGVVVDDEQNGW